MQSEIALWVLAGLAAFRLTWMLCYEDGLFNILINLRTALGAYDYEDYNGEMRTKNWIGRWVKCPYCMGLFPVGILVAAIALYGGKCGDFAIGWIGLAGAIMVITRWRKWD